MTDYIGQRVILSVTWFEKFTGVPAKDRLGTVVSVYKEPDLILAVADHPELIWRGVKREYEADGGVVINTARIELLSPLEQLAETAE